MKNTLIIACLLSASYASVQCMDEKELETFDTSALLTDQDRDDDIRAVEEGRGTLLDRRNAQRLQVQVNHIKLNQEGQTQGIGSREIIQCECPECPEDWPLFAAVAACGAASISLLIYLDAQANLGDYDFDWGQNGPGNMTSTYSMSQSYNISSHMD